MSEIRFFDDFSPTFNFKLQTSRGVKVSLFSRDRLITGVIGRKLDENWPDLVVNLLFACERVCAPGGTWVKFCRVCATGLSEPLPHYSLFCGQL